MGGYLIWRFLGPSQIHQLKSPPNINRFTVYCLPTWYEQGHDMGKILLLPFNKK